MVNLTPEMAQLWASLGPARPGRGRVVEFICARHGEGCSTIAREFARFAAGRAQRPVWLIDLDLLGPGQQAAVTAEAGRFGPLGKPAIASPDGASFFTVQPPGRDREGRAVPDANYLSGQNAGGSRLWVTRFRRERLAAGQTPHLVQTPDYWNAMRRHAEWVVVDSPSADRSQAGLVMAPLMDMTVLVVAADGQDTRAPAALRDAIEQAGGRCAGLVFNRAEIEAPSFLKKILP
jgi:Mrp family chromosome partitioning ATPase